jgi:hypothetical protein
MRIHRSDIVDVLRDAWGDRALEIVKTRVKPQGEATSDSYRWKWIERELTPLRERAKRILARHGIDYDAIR